MPGSLPHLATMPPVNPNGTIGCADPAHSINESPPPGLSRDDRIRWIVNHAPPLTTEQRDRLTVLLALPGETRRDVVT